MKFSLVLGLLGLGLIANAAIADELEANVKGVIMGGPAPGCGYTAVIHTSTLPSFKVYLQSPVSPSQWTEANVAAKELPNGEYEVTASTGSSGYKRDCGSIKVRLVAEGELKAQIISK